MLQSLVVVMILLTVITIPFSQSSPAQVPSSTTDLSSGKTVTLKPVIAPKKFDPSLWQRQLAIPFAGPRDFLANQPDQAYSSDVVLNFGPLQLVSRMKARLPGQNVFYPSLGRPSICFRGVCPNFRLAKEKFTNRYGFKIGFKMQF